MNEEYTDYCSHEIVKRLLEIDDSLLDQRISDDADMDAWSHPEKYYIDEEYGIIYVIPTLYAVQKWLMKEKDIHVLPYIIETSTENLYSVSIYHPYHHGMVDVEGTYEKALEIGIEKALELI